MNTLPRPEHISFKKSGKSSNFRTHADEKMQKNNDSWLGTTTFLPADFEDAHNLILMAPVGMRVVFSVPTQKGKAFAEYEKVADGQSRYYWKHISSDVFKKGNYPLRERLSIKSENGRYFLNENKNYEIASMKFSLPKEIVGKNDEMEENNEAETAVERMESLRNTDAKLRIQYEKDRVQQAVWEILTRMILVNIAQAKEKMHAEEEAYVNQTFLKRWQYEGFFNGKMFVEDKAEGEKWEEKKEEKINIDMDGDQKNDKKDEIILDHRRLLPLLPLKNEVKTDSVWGNEDLNFDVAGMFDNSDVKVGNNWEEKVESPDENWSLDNVNPSSMKEAVENSESTGGEFSLDAHYDNQDEQKVQNEVGVKRTEDQGKNIESKKPEKTKKKSFFAKIFSQNNRNVWNNEKKTGFFQKIVSKFFKKPAPSQSQSENIEYLKPGSVLTIAEAAQISGGKIEIILEKPKNWQPDPDYDEFSLEQFNDISQDNQEKILKNNQKIADLQNAIENEKNNKSASQSHIYELYLEQYELRMEQQELRGVKNAYEKRQNFEKIKAEFKEYLEKIERGEQFLQDGKWNIEMLRDEMELLLNRENDVKIFE